MDKRTQPVLHSKSVDWFINCTNGTKSRNSSNMILLYFSRHVLNGFDQGLTRMSILKGKSSYTYQLACSYLKQTKVYINAPIVIKVNKRSTR